MRVEGCSHVVEPPTVAQALMLLASHAGAKAGQADDLRVWQHAALAWLPHALHVDVVRLPFEWSEGIVARLVFEGVPLPRPAVARLSASPASADADSGAGAVFERMQAFDAADAMGRVAATFGGGFGAVYAMPWPVFLLALREAARVDARRDLAALTLEALPHMKDESERRAVLDRLRALSGADDAEAAMSRDEKIERGKDAARRLRELMGMPPVDAAPPVTP